MIGLGRDGSKEGKELAGGYIDDPESLNPTPLKLHTLFRRKKGLIRA